MDNTSQCLHISFTEKNGYTWRKRIDGKIVDVSLRTRELSVAQKRAAQLMVHFLKIKTLSLSADAVRASLTSVRNQLLDNEQLNVLLGQSQNFDLGRDIPLTNSDAQIRASESTTGFPALESTPQFRGLESTAQIRALITLSQAMDEWAIDMKSEWKSRTEMLNRKSIEMFSEWASQQHIKHVQEISKQHIASYKEWLETRYEAPRSRQDALVKLQALFNFCINKRDWLSEAKNPVAGMTYTKLVNVNNKTEIKPEVFREAIDSWYVTNYKGRLKELMLILWNTGMRISEAIQLTPEDFREVDGIKCISINTENGKQVKCASSIRNIPINNHLNELYDVLSALTKGKPVLGWYKNNAAASRVANAFSQLGYNHSTHDFRYSLSNRLRDLDVQDSVRYAILGHANSVTTDRVYQTRKPLLQMKKALERI
ncbi:tyrosine-type recombinase/integrase [Klebsiella quasivariicola]|uniref:Site-specific tyrosine recombinase XerD n=1 Tax=Klebsiella quasivariicola TaxID=2026240 RepID=A0A8B4TLS6_9ENTR|nr:site-specific integrase [Klebsiella quasivariicola]SXD86837.1 site-specific tyrosine recombinase XerD [Klebsiella quasivariicola]